MSDRFHPISLDKLAGWIAAELDREDAIFGIPRELFFRPRESDPYRTVKYGQLLETPFGVAAGPHSQLAQNIVIAWLCGARFMELKTVQTLDELEIAKPCIDMEDEGYNCEWSQELKVAQSFEEYLRAWVLIHALHAKLGLPGDRPGVIFNLSVGYDLKGIRAPNVQWFLDKAEDAAAEKAEMVDIVAGHLPEVRDIAISDRLSDSVTLSTMHGCPPDEIESISSYLIDERGLHTSVKLNPTLLGPEELRRILGEELGYEDVVVPDAAFEHDLQYADAVPMLGRLEARAQARGVQFGVKLTNTLEVENHRRVFPTSETMMYLSGRPLHALTANLAARLGRQFGGELFMSFAGGADAFNVVDLLRSGMKTITVCSDLLKSGGYLRMLQYLEKTAEAMSAAGAATIEDLIAKTAPQGTAGGTSAAALANLEAYAQKVRGDAGFEKGRYMTWKSKTDRKLGLFDCVEAPCTDRCPIDQNVPDYMRAVREGRFEDAVDLARGENVIPTVLGRVCDRKCQDTCIRTHYDEPLAIREMKRFIMSKEAEPRVPAKTAARGHEGVRVAVIGAGPCGLAAAYDLARAGYPCTIFERGSRAGGMTTATIPHYRLPIGSMEQDERILRALGVDFRYGQVAGVDFTLSDLREQGFAYVVVGVGAQIGRRLGIDGEEAEGVWDAIEFLRRVRDGEEVELGRRVGIIGAGDVAMDSARTSYRLTDSEVMVIYRRTVGEMPADPEEVEGLIEEGIAVHELVSPRAIETEDGVLRALICQQMELGPRSEDGRRRPVAVPGEEVRFPLDTLLLAISQNAILDFFGDEPPALTPKGYIAVDPETFETSLPGVFSGGDAAAGGPGAAVEASGDGRRIALSIRHREEGFVPDGALTTGKRALSREETTELIRRRSRREFRVEVPKRPVDDRKHFGEVIFTLSDGDAKQEAARCLDCQDYCSLCVGVCPNRAIFTYRSEPFEAALPTLTREGAGFEQGAAERLSVQQTTQVAVITDFCNECGNCVTFCPTADRPYVDKPRFYYDLAEFEAETDNAFRIERRGDAPAIRGRFGGRTHELVLKGGEARYRAPGVEARLATGDLRLIEATPTGDGAAAGPLSLKPAAQLYALLSSIDRSMPFLPPAG